MTKRSLAMRSTSFVGHPFSIGRSTPARGSMDRLRQVDVRLHALEMRAATPIPPAILAAVDDARRMRALTRDPLVFNDELPNAVVTPAVLAIADDARRARDAGGPPVLHDELPNAATAPGWYDEEGGFHPPMGEAGVEALRRLFRDRRLDDGHRLPI
jgi:hypothetical protein